MKKTIIAISMVSLFVAGTLIAGPVQECRQQARTQWQQAKKECHAKSDKTKEDRKAKQACFVTAKQKFHTDNQACATQKSQPKKVEKKSEGC